MAFQPPRAGTGSWLSVQSGGKDGPMDQDRKEPHPDDRKERKEEAERNRRKMDEVPPPGTDPLHEGP
jgi:hypothetical protein